jgi:hypothetical protein
MSALRKEKPTDTEQVAQDLEERRRNFSRPEIVADPDRQSSESATATAANPNATEAALPDRTVSTASAHQPPATEQAEATPSSTTSREPNRPQPTDARTPLFDDNALRDFRARWDQVQTSFVDEPRHAVEQADALVATIIQRITDQFADERSKLEKQWESSDKTSAASTEDLRQGLQRYRAFFDRLLTF